MAITFSCQCGKQIKVADKFAGRRGKCPACGDVISIPHPEPDPISEDADADLIYEALSPPSDPQPVQQQPQTAGNACNACGKPMSPQAIVCTHCGFHKVSHTYMKSAQGVEPAEKETSAALLSIAGFGLRWWKLAVIVLPLAAAGFWYYTGPGRDLQVIKYQAVNVIETIHTGETREAFSLYTQQGDMSLGIKGPQSKSNPNPFINNEEHFSMGGSDEVLVICPEDDGKYIALQVALSQGTIRNNGRTIKYDSEIAGEDFKLISNDGGAPVESRVLYTTFENLAEIDIGSADTSNHKSLFPSEPTTMDVTQEFGSTNGEATWNDRHARGKINFSCAYPYGDGPTPKGLSATGRIKVFNDEGDSANLEYEGGTLKVKWDPGDEGWWSKKKYRHQSQPNPYHRYNFGLLFERPKGGGNFDITYCDKVVASVYFEPLPQPKPPPVSPIKSANSTAQHGPPTNNPLAYFQVLSDARGKARGIVSASNLRQLGIAMHLYLEQNNGKWPDRLDQLQSIMPAYEEVMKNPRTKERIGFIYVKPEPGAPPATTAVIHESWQGKPDPTGAVLYADGHIE